MSHFPALRSTTSFRAGHWENKTVRGNEGSWPSQFHSCNPRVTCWVMHRKYVLLGLQLQVGCNRQTGRQGGTEFAEHPTVCARLFTVSHSLQSEHSRHSPVSGENIRGSGDSAAILSATVSDRAWISLDYKA